MNSFTAKPVRKFAWLLLTAIVVGIAAGQANATEKTLPSAQQATAMLAAELPKRFAAADVDHDGKLTRDEARAGMPRVSRFFDQIDSRKRGYVTVDDINLAFQAEVLPRLAK
jgi:hypothetical protein